MLWLGGKFCCIFLGGGQKHIGGGDKDSIGSNFPFEGSGLKI